MKKTFTALALVAASAFAAVAQDATPNPSPAPDGAPPPPPRFAHRGELGGPRGPMREIMESLTPAEREQLKAARKKAKDDAAVAEARKNLEAAHKALRDAEKAAMLKADSNIGPVLEKLQETAQAHRPAKKAPKPPKPE